MKWFLDFTTRGKLFACFGLMCVLLAGVIATAYNGISAILESQDRLYKEDFADVRDLMALCASQNEMRALMFEVQLLSKRTEHRQAEVAAQSLHDLGQKLKQLAEQYKV